MRKYTTVLIVIFMGAFSFAGMAQRVMDQHLRHDYVPFGLIQKDSLALLPKIVYPDTIELQKPCIRLNMRYFKPEKELVDNMPNMEPGQNIHFSMPIVGQDSSCWKATKPGK
ncbi:hypothetical protein [Halalkalibaculum sp. DA384]|uniref:hypothetical protein n=1 Tax=Halalkalibaculum sp. DA384 TaxID=3373606 RepID=UPI003753F3D2